MLHKLQVVAQKRFKLDASTLNDSECDTVFMCRLGASDSTVMQSFAIGESKLHEDLGAFVDYLDYIGPEKAFHVGDDGVVSEEAPPGVVLTGPHSSAYGDIDDLVSSLSKG